MSPYVSSAGAARTRAAWVAAWNGRSARNAAALYAENAVFYTTIHGFRVGRDAIEKLFELAFSVATPHIEMTSTTVEASGNLAFDSGTYVQRLTVPAGSFEVHGSYLMVMQRSGERWLIARHMWTEDAQPQPTPTPRPSGSMRPPEASPQQPPPSPAQTPRPLDVRGR